MSSLSVDLKDFLLTGKVRWKKKEAKVQEMIGKVMISLSVQRLCKLKLIKLTFCLLFSTNWNHAWVHDVEGT